MGVDGSDASLGAVGAALELASERNAEVIACFVHTHPAVTEYAGEALAAERDITAETEDEIRRRLADLPGSPSLVVRGPGRPGHELVDAAADLDAEMIVVATRGHGLAHRTGLGSVSHHLVNNSPITVHVVRAAESDGR